MPSYNTSAIVLRRINYGETDKILTLFSREHGRISAIAKGARKAVSRLSGATEVLPGMTRSTVYREVRQTAAIQSPAIPRNAMCVFFALEPNLLPVGGAR